jgi:hypothetical protein
MGVNEIDQPEAEGKTFTSSQEAPDWRMRTCMISSEPLDPDYHIEDQEEYLKAKQARYAAQHMEKETFWQFITRKVDGRWMFGKNRGWIIALIHLFCLGWCIGCIADGMVGWGLAGLIPIPMIWWATYQNYKGRQA